MSNIPYPHTARILRRAATPGAPTPQDAYGRKTRAAETTVADVPAWFQEYSAQEQASFAAKGATVLTDIVFMDPTDVRSGDFLQRIDTGGRYEIIGEPINPDGGTDHLEISAIKHTPVPA